LNELLKDNLRTLQVILAFEEEYKDIGSHICKVLFPNVSGRRQPRNFARKSDRWDCFRSSTDPSFSRSYRKRNDLNIASQLITLNAFSS
jgi:hypothetical protein